MLIKILEKLVSFQTTPNNFKEKKKAVFWILKLLKKYPLHLKYFEFGGHPSLVAFPKNKSTKIILAAHLDVVAAPLELFRLKIKKGKIFGRGVLDMKFAIACYLRLIEELKNNLGKLNFAIMITSDEEIGGFWGTKKLVEKGLKGKVVFLPDGGYNWKVERQAKGTWFLRIDCQGKSAHGSRPWQGAASNERLIEFLQALKKFFPSEPCKIANHWHRTLNIGVIKGGDVINQVSNFSQAFLDIRFLTEKEREKIKEYLIRLQKQFHFIKVKELILARPYELDLRNQYVKIFLQILEKEFKRKPEFSLSHGSSDARFFWEKKIPVILVAPKGGGHHSEKEWLDVKDLERYYFLLKKFILESLF
jgi:succinyl-diaminopimelate desuccinylase